MIPLYSMSSPFHQNELETVKDTRLNSAEPGHPAQPLKVGTNLTGELTVTPYGES